jgi:hypothetical protein
MSAAWDASAWANIDAGQRFSTDLHTATLTELRRWQIEAGRLAGVAALPIVIIDPIEPLGDVLTTLARLATLARDEGWIVVASCDVQDGSANGSRNGDRAFARAIDSLASVRVGVTSVDERELVLESCHRRLGPRGTATLRWHRASGRLQP